MRLSGPVGAASPYAATPAVQMGKRFENKSENFWKVDDLAPSAMTGSPVRVAVGVACCTSGETGPGVRHGVRKSLFTY